MVEKLASFNLSLAANFFGKGWSALLALLITPLYVKFLGIEAYGLIGFYITLSTLLFLFDFGMGDTLCREAALIYRPGQNPKELQNTLRTLEVLYWGCGLFISCGIWLTATWIGEHWLQSKNSSLEREQLPKLISLMALSFFFQWPFLFYCKGLQGIQAHLTQNFLLFIGSTVRHAGGILFLWMATPTLEHFFYWQTIAFFFQTSFACIFLWKKLRGFFQAGLSVSSLRRIWKFSFGMTAIGLTVVLLVQVDKIVVSRYFSLKELGYYCLSFTVASSLFYLIQPLVIVFYPKLVQEANRQNDSELKSTYHKACQLTVLILSPFAALLTFYPEPIICLWTQNPTLAKSCAHLTALFSLGVFLNCCMHMPYYLQLAFGETSLTLRQNFFSLLILVPALPLLSKLFGLEGAASFYALLNIGYILFVIPQVHKKFLKNEKIIWYRDDFLLPAIAAFLPIYLLRFIFKNEHLPLMICGAYSISLVSIFLSTPLTQKWLKNKWAQLQP